MLQKVIRSIVLNSVLVFIFAKFLPELGLQIEPMSALTIGIFFLLGALFWLTNGVLKKLINIVAWPIKVLTLGLSSIVINGGMMYLFKYLINSLNLGVEIVLGVWWKILILSAVIALLNLILKKIL